MAVLWCGGEDIDYLVVPSGFVFSTIGNTYRRTAFSRVVLIASNSGGIALTCTFPGGPVTTAGLSAQLYPQTTTGKMIGLVKSSTSGAGLWIGASSGKITLYTFDGSSTWTELAAETGTTLGVNVVQRLDMYVTSFDDTVNGNVKVYHQGGGSPIIDYTGNLQAGGIASLDQVGVSGGANMIMVSEIIVSDDDPRLYVGLYTLAPNGAGASTFTSGAYTDIDEVLSDDTDILVSATAAQAFNCALSDLPNASTIVRAVKVMARAAKGATAGGPTTLGLGVKSGSTVDVANKSLAANYLSYERLMTINPVTASDFTNAEVNALLLELDSVA